MARLPYARFPAVMAGAAVLALTAVPLSAVVLRAGGFGGLGVSDLAAVRFTLLQAGLSAAISVALAVPLARALARRQFPGRGAVIALLGAPFILPVLVAVLGLLAIFGRAGVLNQGLAVIGLPPLSIYGLGGVVLAHVFFNLPLATRLILHGWLSIPGERFRLAAALGMGPREVVRFLERPMLRAVLPGTVAAVFLICMTSFAVALTLGGGPRATTVELAIYQAFRFDFDLGRAALLASLQAGLCVGAAFAAGLAGRAPAFGAGLDRRLLIWTVGGAGALLADLAMIAVAGLFLALPLLAIILAGLPGILDLPASVWRAGAVSIGLALTSAGLMLALALPLAMAAARRPHFGLAETLAMLPLAASPLVLGTGLFLLLRPVAAPETLALPLTALVNATMALPFAFRVLLPELRMLQADYGRLADSLDLQGAARLRLLTLPRLRRPLGFALGLAAALAMGDLGVIALFAGGEVATLPLELYRLMGAYRMDQAAGAALLLVALAFALFLAFDRGGRAIADT